MLPATLSACSRLLAMPDFRVDQAIEAGSQRYAVLHLEPDVSLVEQSLWDDAVNAVAVTGLTLILVLALIYYAILPLFGLLFGMLGSGGLHLSR